MGFCRNAKREEPGRRTARSEGSRPFAMRMEHGCGACLAERGSASPEAAGAWTVRRARSHAAGRRAAREAVRSPCAWSAAERGSGGCSCERLSLPQSISEKSAPGRDFSAPGACFYSGISSTSPPRRGTFSGVCFPRRSWAARSWKACMAESSWVARMRRISMVTMRSISLPAE